VVLGGIINRSNTESRSGVPILSSIPILGGLFSNKKKSDEKQKLLVFITPRLVNIDDPYDFAQVDNIQQLKTLRNSGATGFLETNVDDSYLDWSNEEDNEQQAILDALENIDDVPKGNAQTKEKTPSLEEQMDEGVVRMKRKK
ncbi:type II and III secretion system protein, partial [bacterium]|nr:type II and III secretion system protein [bacterium]